MILIREYHCWMIREESNGKISGCYSLYLMISTTLQAGTELSVEYLYWRVQEDQLYPVISYDQYVSDGLNIFDLTPQNQTFEYTSGVRLTVGYDCFCRNYDLNFAWTHIHPCTTTKHLIKRHPHFFCWSNKYKFSSATSGESQWDLNYDMLDLTLDANIRYVDTSASVRILVKRRMD